MSRHYADHPYERVTFTLIYEGEPKWIAETLARSLMRDGANGRAAATRWACDKGEIRRLFVSTEMIDEQPTPAPEIQS